MTFRNHSVSRMDLAAEGFGPIIGGAIRGSESPTRGRANDKFLLSPESRTAMLHQKAPSGSKIISNTAFSRSPQVSSLSPQRRPNTAPAHSRGGGGDGDGSPTRSQRSSVTSRGSLSSRHSGSSGYGQHHQQQKEQQQQQHQQQQQQQQAMQQQLAAAGLGTTSAGVGEAMRRKDVVIHVFDENRNSKRDFLCKRHVLVREMKYFSNYLNGRNGSGTAQVEIDVHCDIEVFEWLMLFVTKQRPSLGALFAPQHSEAEPRTAISILISSNFLQMGALEDICLGFVKDNMNEIVKVPIDMSCINKVLFTKLVRLYTIEEMSSIVDAKDKLL
ncbi:hypothetical protein HK101_004690, partial [Irineochytrium annulatum]